MRPGLVAGCDVAYDEEHAYAAWAVLSFPGLERVDVAAAVASIAVEYRTGYLARRELPALLAAFARLKTRPEVVICDGAGIAHPRRCGLACELGRAAGLPTIGCAKTRLIGDDLEPGQSRGSHVPIRVAGEVLGTVLRTRTGVKPVYVSPGFRVSVNAAWQLVLACCRGFRIPEPLRQAHSESLRLRATGRP